MKKSILEHRANIVETVVCSHPDGISIQNIQDELNEDITRRSLQRLIKRLIEEGRIVKKGESRGTKYYPTAVNATSKVQQTAAFGSEPVSSLSLSKDAVAIQNYVCRSILSRTPDGYEREFLFSYKPNDSAYLTATECTHLQKIGTPVSAEQPAGTYARQILSRLLIDLSWNSSRLEGNTYSQLDTKRLISFGKEADGKKRLEAQMILNHKDAIEFLVDSAGETGFDRRTFLNLHALLANNLLPDEAAIGRLRKIPVSIEQSVFHPLEVPQLIEEYFNQFLAIADSIVNPYERALFVMVQLPYLQPFDDVNKRVSRLAANIPMIKSNLIPLSFTEVPDKIYTEAILGVYEQNQINLLKEVFIWAYERSAYRYAAVRQSIREPDPFRMKHRTTMFEVVRLIVLERLSRIDAFNRITAWTELNIEVDEREQFRQICENEVLSLHEGNFFRYKVTPSQFNSWQEIWVKQH